MSRIAEKIELAKELGFTSMADMLLSDYAAENQIDIFVKSGFRRITESELRDRLVCVYVNLSYKYKLILYCIFGLSLLCIALYWLYGNSGPHTEGTSVCIFNALCGLGIGGIFTSAFICFMNISKPTLDNDLLANWRNDIPCTALEAVKEAKEKGIDLFNIYYLQERSYANKRIIVGRVSNPLIKKLVMYEIFSWDYGKTDED